MNTKRIILLLLFVFAFNGGSNSQYLLVTDTFHVDVSSTFDSVQITSSGVLIGDDSIAVLGNMTIDSGGIATHSAHHPAGLRLSVGGTLTIHSGATIDVTGKGLFGGGQSGSAFGKSGETYGKNDSIVEGARTATVGSGGSYGGRGADGDNASSTPPYGLVEEPHYLGSGGGSNYYSEAGGNGGGRITIIAGACAIDGVIRSNGNPGTAFYPTGAGSGGSIRLTVGGLSGAGAIEAVGGNGLQSWGTSGSGGGGRIAITYDVSTLPIENISARGGSGGYKAAAGTIYLKDNLQAYNNILIDNGGTVSNSYTLCETNMSTLQSLKLGGAANIKFNGDVTIAEMLFVTGGSILEMDSGSIIYINAFDTTSIKSGTVNIQGGSRLFIASNRVIVGTGVTLIKDGTFGANDSLTTLTILNGGTVTHSLRLLAGLNLHLLDTLNIRNGGAIDVSGKGLLGGHPVTNGPGETYNENDSIVDGAGGNGTGGAGGSYGGQGAVGTNCVPSSPYGLIEDARHLGSGGGGNPTAWGGHGGGRATIITNECIVDGAIRANGAGGVGGFTPTGGGSGGAIKILAGSVSGAGVIETAGGNGQQYNSYSGSGGGGRIAIIYDSMSLPDSNISARGGTSQYSASAGTIYLKDNAQSTGIVIVGNNNITTTLFTPLRTNLPSIQRLSVLNRGQLQTIATDDAVFSEVRVESNSILLLDTSTAVQTPVVHITGATLTTNVDRAFPVGTDLQLKGGGIFNVRNNSTLSIGVFDTTNIHAGTVDVQEGSRLDIAPNNATIGASVTLIKDGTFGTNDSLTSLTILNGGTVTHSLRLLAGLRLRLLDTLDIRNGGSINVSGKGLLGGHPVTNGPGETYNENDSIVDGAGGNGTGGAGGSYGGQGAVGTNSVPSLPYGFIEDARHLGSGGGGNPTGWGGHGGGRATIITNECIVDGAIRANGAGGIGGFTPTGGGSGGAIKILAGSVSGAGVIEAAGGNGQQYISYGGSGGGGRVAIFYDTMSLPDSNISARGGTSQYSASAGTIYLKDNAQSTGIVIVGNNNITTALFTPLRTNLASFQRLSVIKRGQFRTAATDNAVFGEVRVESNSTFLLDTSTVVQTPVVHITGATLTTNVDRAFPVGTDLQLNGGGTINVRNNSTLSIGVFDTTNIHAGTVDVQEGSRLEIAPNNATIGAGVTLVKDGMFGTNDSLTTLTILNGGKITHSSRLLAGLRLRLLDTLEIRTGGAIDVSGKGLLGGHPVGVTGGPGETYNANDSIVDGAGGAETGSAGGSYGGQGAVGINSNPSSPYGLIEDPQHLGSGAGGNRYSWGGHGGGRATITVNECVIDGAIRANGAGGIGGFTPTGGGSGGAIKILAGSVSGAGVIEAAGGNGQQYISYGGSGGGGRIAIIYDSMSLPESNISARGGTSQYSASAGTIYLKDNALSLGNVIIDNANIVSNKFTPWRSALARIQNLSVMHKAYFEVGSEVGIEGQLLITAGCKIGRP